MTKGKIEKENMSKGKRSRTGKKTEEKGPYMPL